MRQEERFRIFGLTLSKRARNNILIYAVLIISSVLWYVSPKMPKEALENPGETTQLMPAEANLSVIAIDDQVLQKVEQKWVCQAPCSLSNSQAEAVAKRWLNLSIQQTEQQPSDKLTDVLLQFADGNEARVEIYMSPQLLIKLPQQNRTFMVVDTQVEELVGQ